MGRNIQFLLFLFVPAFLFADENPFMAVRERYQWAIEQVMEHKAFDENTITGQPTGNGDKKVKIAQTPTPVFTTQTYRFQSETDKAKVNVQVTDFGNSFIVDVTSDQAIQGWLIKRQSTRDVFLKGAGPTDNPYQCRIRVDRPYLKDFGLTVYVTQDSDPAFIQLF
ncbi:MAG TPA: hypothetical protein VJ873_01745 [bacterium]|nr:hypothetical protein [bacterium]